MCDEWQPSTRGRCGECGGHGEIVEDHVAGPGNHWSYETGVAGSAATTVHHYEERWACECGCIWHEQYRWRGQTKESQA